MGTFNSDEHDAEHGVWSEPEQPLEHRDEPGEYFISTGNRTGNKGGDVKRAGSEVSASERNEDE
jgi:hypothetical protein